MNLSQLGHYLFDLAIVDNPVSLVIVFSALGSAAYRQYTDFHRLLHDIRKAGPGSSPQISAGVLSFARQIYTGMEFLVAIGILLNGYLLLMACSGNATYNSYCGLAQTLLTMLILVFPLVYISSRINMTRATTRLCLRPSNATNSIGAVICLTDGRRLKGSLPNLNILDLQPSFIFMRPDGLTRRLRKSQVEVAFLWNCGENHAEFADDLFTEGPRTLTLKYPYTEVFKGTRYHDCENFRVMKVDKKLSGTEIALARRSHLIERVS